MSTVPDSEAFDRGIAPFLKILLPGKAQQLMDYQVDAALKERIETLADKSTEGNLSDQERREYEGYVRANKFVAILQRKAREQLNDDRG